MTRRGCKSAPIQTTIRRPSPSSATFDEALAFVREHMPDQGMQIIGNVAEALVNAFRRTKQAGVRGMGDRRTMLTPPTRG
jgi:hypothetical protein